jgi:hypothetical protein
MFTNLIVAIHAVQNEVVVHRMDWNLIVGSTGKVA